MPPAQLRFGGATMGPVHKQPAVNEPLLVALFSHWSAPQWVPPITSNQLVSELTLAVLLCHWSAPQWFPPRSNQLLVSNCLWSCSKPLVGWGRPRPRATVNQGQLVTTDSAYSVWCSGPQVESRWKRQIPAFSLALGQWINWELRISLGLLSCRTPEPFPWPPTGLGLGLQAAVNFSPALLCDLRAVAICLGHSLRYPDPPTAPSCPRLGSLRSLRASWVGCLAPSVMTLGQSLETRS